MRNGTVDKIEAWFIIPVQRRSEALSTSKMPWNPPASRLIGGTQGTMAQSAKRNALLYAAFRSFDLGAPEFNEGNCRRAVEVDFAFRYGGGPPIGTLEGVGFRVGRCFRMVGGKPLLISGLEERADVD